MVRFFLPFTFMLKGSTSDTEKQTMWKIPQKHHDSVPCTYCEMNDPHFHANHSKEQTQESSEDDSFVEPLHGEPQQLNVTSTMLGTVPQPCVDFPVEHTLRLITTQCHAMCPTMNWFRQESLYD